MCWSESLLGVIGLSHLRLSIRDIFMKKTGATLIKSRNTVIEKTIKLGPGANSPRPVTATNIWE
jgi:hypothetical protein